MLKLNKVPSKSDALRPISAASSSRDIAARTWARSGAIGFAPSFSARASSRSEIEQGPFEIRCVAAHQRGEFVARYRRAHLGEIRRNRFRAQFLRARLIQERLVEGAYLAFEIGGLVWRFRGRLLHHVVEPRFRAIRHQQPKTDGRLIRG